MALHNLSINKAHKSAFDIFQLSLSMASLNGTFSCYELICSKTSLNRPSTGVNSGGPFMDIVDIQNFTKHRKDNFGFVKSRSISRGVGMGGSLYVISVMHRLWLLCLDFRCLTLILAIVLCL